MKRFMKLLAVALVASCAWAANEMTDSVLSDGKTLSFGTAKPFNAWYDPVQTRLEVNDLSGNTLLSVTDDGTTGTLNVSGKLSSPLLNLTPGSAPGSPSNGDLWTTSAGLYARINGATVGPMLGSGGAGAFSTLDVSGQTAFGPGAAPGDYGNYVQNIFNSAPTQILTSDTYRTIWTTLAPAPTGDTNAYYQALYAVVDPSLTATANYTSRVEGAVIQVLPPATGKTMDHVYGVTAGTWWGSVGHDGVIDELKNFNAENSCGVGDVSTWHGSANKMYGFFCDYMTYADHENYGLYILGVGGGDTKNEAIHVEQGLSYFNDDVHIRSYSGTTTASYLYNGSGASGQKSRYVASTWGSFSGSGNGSALIGLNVGLKSTDGSFVAKDTHGSMGYGAIGWSAGNGSTNIYGASGATTANAALTLLATFAPTGLTLAGDVAVNGGDLTSTASTFNLLNQPATIVFGSGASTSMTLGNASAANAVNGTWDFAGHVAMGNVGAVTTTETLYVNENASQTSGTIISGSFRMAPSAASAPSGARIALSATAIAGSAQTYPYIAGFNSYVNNGVTSSTTTLLLGGQIVYSNTAAGAVTTAKMLHFSNGGGTSGSNPTWYGLDIDAFTGTGANAIGQTNKRAINIGNISGGSGENYAIYTGTGAVRFGDTLTVASDTDVTTILGRAKVGSPVSDVAYFSHFDQLSSTNYAIKQSASGQTAINSATGFSLDFAINNTAYAFIDTTGINSVADVFAQGGDYTGGVSGTTRGTLKLFHGSGGNTPGYVQLYSPNGTAWYVFVEDDGTLKVHNAAPAANTDGSVVGAQT